MSVGKIINNQINKMTMFSLSSSAFWILIVIILKMSYCEASCYFSSELQGSFQTQSTTTHSQVQYSDVNITEDAIPIWGQCHKRIENNVILWIGFEENNCFRCFHLKLVSRNVLLVHTADKDYISKCYTNENKAIASCPSDEIIRDSNRHAEIILYKTHDFDGKDIQREYCPINGRYKLTYHVDNGGNFAGSERMECDQASSELDNCPSGSAMNLRFRKCSFENHEITYECLGHWQGMDNQKYLALLNVRPNENFAPQYRCAVYTDTLKGGSVSIIFSNDSTCNSAYAASGNSAAIFQTETMLLDPIQPPPWPHQKFCQFPDWTIGHWEHMSIDESTILFKDHTSFKVFTMKCIENQEKSSDKFIVFSRTQCGEESYHCILIKKRSDNILEMKISTETTNNLKSGKQICNEEYFSNTQWLTQARLDHNLIESPCPVNGEFTGKIPDNSGLCAKLASDCTTPDVMHYEVSACGYDEVYEERKYRCLGQWEEDGWVYTYTKRFDIGGYECFIGGMISENKILIKEAGKHCQRAENSEHIAMELNKIESCNKTKTIHLPAIVHSPAYKHSVMNSNKHNQHDNNNDGGDDDEEQPTIIVQEQSHPILLSSSTEEDSSIILQSKSSNKFNQNKFASTTTTTMAPTVISAQSIASSLIIEKTTHFTLFISLAIISHHTVRIFYR